MAHTGQTQNLILNDFCLNGILLLAEQGSGKLNFLWIMAHTGRILNLEYKMAFVVIVFFC